MFTMAVEMNRPHLSHRALRLSTMIKETRLAMICERSWVWIAQSDTVTRQPRPPPPAPEPLDRSTSAMPPTNTNVVRKARDRSASSSSQNKQTNTPTQNEAIDEEERREGEDQVDQRLHPDHVEVDVREAMRALPYDPGLLHHLCQGVNEKTYEEAEEDGSKVHAG